MTKNTFDDDDEEEDCDDDDRCVGNATAILHLVHICTYQQIKSQLDFLEDCDEVGRLVALQSS